MYKKILIIIAIILFISLVVYIVVIDYKNQNNTQKNNQEQEQSTTKPQAENCMGVIEGELSYPSSMVPNGSIVCAKNSGTNNYYCTPNQIVDSKYRNKKGYRLEVPVGVYYISGIFSFFTDNKTQLPQEYKYAGADCNIRNCDDVNASITVGCETISDIDLFRLGELNIFKIFFEK